MKKTYNIRQFCGAAIMALAAGALASCSDDFMERSPLSSISDANYWKSSNDLRLYVNSLYQREDLLTTGGDFHSRGLYNRDGDEGADTELPLNLDYSQRMNGEGRVPDDGGGWGSGDWEALRQINYFMDHYKQVEEVVGFDEVKQYVGEALFFRSIFYFAKLRRFGKLPWASSTVTTSSAVLTSGRLPRNQVVDSILHDLDYAIDYLPARKGGSWSGRVDKETALALAARIALYEGTWEKYHNGTAFAADVNESQKFLNKAVAYSDELITMSETNGYPALDNVGVENGYRDLFNQVDYSSSKEVMFWRKFEMNQNHHWDGYYGSCSATKNLVDSYLKDDGSPIDPATFDYTTLVNVAAGRDPRLKQTICIPGNVFYMLPQVRYFVAPWFDGWEDEGNRGGYQIYKGHVVNSYEYGDDRNQNQAYIYFRYGETLLVYAEAKAELNQCDQACLDRSINKLRARVGMPDMSASVAVDNNFEFSSLAGLLQAIRRERKVELAVEGFRVDDIMRWAAASELIVGKKPLGAYKAQWQGFDFEAVGASEKDKTRQDAFTSAWSNLTANTDGFIDPFNARPAMANGYKFRVAQDYLYPIPTIQLTLNPNLGQNPEW
jgi:hypothetical protein